MSAAENLDFTGRDWLTEDEAAAGDRRPIVLDDPDGQCAQSRGTVLLLGVTDGRWIHPGMVAVDGSGGETVNRRSVPASP